jgi:hypothetical protein
LSGFHSARLGTQWRVLYRIDESKHAIIVQDIQRRSAAYRPRYGHASRYYRQASRLDSRTY